LDDDNDDDGDEDDGSSGVGVDGGDDEDVAGNVHVIEGIVDLVRDLEEFKPKPILPKPNPKPKPKPNPKFDLRRGGLEELDDDGR